MLIVCLLLNHAFQTNNIPYPCTRTASISTNRMGLLIRQQMWAAWISNVNNARFLTAEYCLSCLHLWKVGYRFIYHHLSVKEHAKKCICCLWWLNIITLLHTRIRQCFWLSEEKKNQQHTDKRRRVKKRRHQSNKRTISTTVSIFIANLYERGTSPFYAHKQI